MNHSAVVRLKNLGLSDVLEGSSAPELTRVELRAGSQRLSLPLPGGRALSRAMLDQRLVAAAVSAGVTFRDEMTAVVSHCDAAGRLVQLRDAHGAAHEMLRAKVVLAADGLGHSSASGLAEIHDRPVRSSRVGAGCEVSEFPAEYAVGTIHMAIGRGGYVGLVRVETGVLNVAAAFDPASLREAGGPGPAAVRVLAEAGFPAIAALTAADWLGTPALTRTTAPMATERLFFLGDAAGYVEPFTGEGIGWALTSAVAAAPLACAAVEHWEPRLAKVWAREHSRLIRQRQRTCQALARLLKQPVSVRVAMTVLPWLPRLMQRLVQAVSSPSPPFLAAALDIERIRT